MITAQDRKIELLESAHAIEIDKMKRELSKLREALHKAQEDVRTSGRNEQIARRAVVAIQAEASRLEKQLLSAGLTPCTRPDLAIPVKAKTEKKNSQKVQPA
jgi:hypothetical protein